MYLSGMAGEDNLRGRKAMTSIVNIPSKVLASEYFKHLREELTDDEIKSLTAFYDGNGFIGIGFLRNGVMTQFADPKKAAAVTELEYAYKSALLKMVRTSPWEIPIPRPLKEEANL